MSRRAPQPKRVAKPSQRPAPFYARPVWISVGLIVLNLFVYAAVRNFDFVNWDDPAYLTNNRHLQGGLTWPNIVWAVTTGYTPYWHPATWLSYLLDVQLFGLNAGAHHVTNVVIHSATTLLVFAVLRRMTGAIGRSAFVAAIFASHPLHVESVVWLAERKDVLSAFFVFLTIWTYLGYVGRPRWNRYLAVCGLAALALMAKPMAVTLPFLLLLVDVWPLQRVSFSRSDPAAWRRVILEKLPLVALSLAVSLSTFIIQRRVGAVAGLSTIPWTFRFENALVAYVGYVLKVFWPTRLAPFYPMHDLSTLLVVSAGLTLVGLTVAAVAYRRSHPYVLVGWLWFLISIAPVSGLIQAGEQAMADRFSYVALVGLIAIVAWGTPELMSRWRYGTRAVPWLAAAAVVLCATVAKAQVATWSDSVTLWRHAVAVIPDNYMAYDKLGDALRDRGQLQDAEAAFQRALALAPTSSAAYQAVVHNNLGLALALQGKRAEAGVEFETAVRLDGSFAEAQSNLGNALSSGGKLSEALAHFDIALKSQPDMTEALIGLGGTLLKLGRPAEALPHFMKALEGNPDLAEAHNGLGTAFALQGQDDQALAHYSRALALNPSLATAHFNLAVLLAKLGKIDEARDHLVKALQIDPGFPGAREALNALKGRL